MAYLLHSEKLYREKWNWHFEKGYNEFEFAYYALITVVYKIAMVTIMPFIRIYTDGIVDVNYDIPILGFFIL